MKTSKFFFAAMMAAAVAVGFTACDPKDNGGDIFGGGDNNGGDNGNGGGDTPTECLTVEQAIAQQGASGEKTVKGYVVGWYNNHKNASQVEFGNVATADTTVNKANVVIADKADETVVANCVCVQLTAGQVRNIVELASNPENLGKELIVKGQLAAYNGMAGVKATSYSEINGKKSTDAIAELLCYRVKAGSVDASVAAAVKVGDVVSVRAKMMRWYETPETSDATFETIGSAAAGAISVADAIALCNAQEQTTDNKNKHVSEEVVVTGTVTKISDPWSEKYSNVTFYIK